MKRQPPYFEKFCWRFPIACLLTAFSFGALAAAPDAQLPDPQSPVAPRGLPFTRSYPLEEIGNVPRGARLTFDRFGRLAVVQDGFYTVLNDTVWLDLEEAGSANVTMSNVVQGEDGRAYYASGGSWGTVEFSPRGKLRPRSLVPADPPKWVLTTAFSEIVVTSQGVYFAGWSGVVFWDFATQKNRFFEVARISKMFRIGDRVYTASFGESLQWVDGRAGVLRPVPHTSFGEAPVDQATSLDATSALLATRDGRILVFDGTTLSPWPVQSRHQLTGRVSSLCRLVDGGVAVAITGKGLFLVSPKGDLLTSLRSSEYQRIIDLATREAGVLWVAGENGVEKVFYGSPLTVFGQRLGLALSWPVVARWRGRVFVASSGQLFEAIPGPAGAASRFELVTGQPAEGVWAIAFNDEHLLVGNAKGAFELGDDGRFSSIVGGIDVGRIVLLGPDLCFLISRTQVAVMRWSGNRWTECAPRIPSVGYAPVVHRAKNSVWLELGANQVVRLSFRDGELHSRLFADFPWKELRWVNVGIVDDTVVLSGPPGQRLFFDENTERFCEAPQLRRLLDQCPRWILRVRKDELGTIWATHEQGVVALVPQDNGYRIDATSFELNNEHFPLVQILPGNDIWFATGQSLYHVERRDTADSHVVLRPMLVSATDGRTNVELLREAAPAAAPLRLPYGQNDLSFRFFAGSYAWRRAPIYEFRLADGQDWRTLGTGSLLSFPGLREGNYRLDVRIANAEGSASQPVSFPFEILPPWPRTGPAYALYVLSGLLAVSGLLRWSVQRAHRRNVDLEKIVGERTAQLESTMQRLNEETRNAATLAERDRLAGEIHDSLQQGLSGLILQLDATLKLATLTSDVRSRLNVARNMVSFTRHEVQHAIWDMESPLLEDTELGEALRKIAGLIGSATAKIEVTVSGAPVSLPSAIQHNLLRIAQEAITNAVRHAGPSVIAVRLEYLPDAIALTVIDDGVGFRPEDVLANGIGHFGLRGLRGRANKIGGRLRIESSPENGASIEIVVPFPFVAAASVNHATSSAN